MNREDVARKVKELVSEVLELKCSIEEIKEDDMLSTYGLSSFTAIRLIVLIESEYDFEFLDEDLVFENFESLNKLVDYIMKSAS